MSLSVKAPECGERQMCKLLSDIAGRPMGVNAAFCRHRCNISGTESERRRRLQIWYDHYENVRKGELVLPPPKTMAKNLAITMRAIGKKFVRDVTKDGLWAGLKGMKCCHEQRDRRQEICKACEHQEFVNGHERCLSFPGGEPGCGCYLNQKRKYAAARCGQGKWDEIDSEYEAQ